MRNFVALTVASALRFNEVPIEKDPEVVLSVEGISDELGGRRRRRRKSDDDGFYDSSQVEYIVQFPGVRTTNAAHKLAFTDQIAKDVGSQCFSKLQTTSDVAETEVNVQKLIKANLKITDWAVKSNSAALLQVGAASFNDLISFPENPGWNLSPGSKINPSVFDALWKTTAFKDLVDAKITASRDNGAPAIKLIFSNYGVAAGDIVITERTTSTSTLKGLMEIAVTVSNPPGVMQAIPVKGSLTVDFTPVAVGDVGNALAFATQIDEALTVAYGVSKDYVTVERVDIIDKEICTQIMFKIDTKSENANADAEAELLVEAALLDVVLQKIWSDAAATVLKVDKTRVTVTTFKMGYNKGTLNKAGDGGARPIDIQLTYTNPRSASWPPGTNPAVPDAFEEEATKVRAAIGTSATPRIAFVQKVYNEVVTKLKAGKKYAVPGPITAGNGVTGTGLDLVFSAGGDAEVIKTYNMATSDCVATKHYSSLLNTADGRVVVTCVAGAMNAQFVQKGLTLEAASNKASYRVSYQIRIKNSVDANAATLVEQYRTNALTGRDPKKPFAVSLTKNLGEAPTLLTLGISVTETKTLSENTKTEAS